MELVILAVAAFFSGWAIGYQSRLCKVCHKALPKVCVDGRCGETTARRGMPWTAGLESHLPAIVDEDGKPVAPTRCVIDGERWPCSTRRLEWQ